MCLAPAIGQTGQAVAALPGAANGRIAFVSDRDPLGSGNLQVFVMGSHGENPTNLSTNNLDEEDPSFSPDGTRIAFVSFPDFEEDRFASEELYVMKADGSGRRRLTHTLADESEPVFSPDGTKIAFRYANEETGREGIQLINADGTGRTTLLSGEASEPSWSPDGTKIAYAGPGGIWVVDVASGARTQLTSGPAIESEPDWSPDGTKIVYVSDPLVETSTSLFSNPDVWVMDADGSNPIQLTHDRLADEEPAFSPDGTKILYTRRRPQTDLHAIFEYPADIRVMNADGSGDRLVLGGPASDESPSWQPVGRRSDATPPSFVGSIAIPPVLAIVQLPAASSPRAPIGSATASRRRGATIRFGLSERASVKLAVERTVPGRKVRRGRHVECVPTRRRVARGRRCRATKLKGWIVRRGRRGRNRVRFTGRIGRRPLRPGRYRIRAGAVDRRANPARHKVSRAFRIVRR